MAIFFVRASVVSRAKGQSAIARSAYNGRQRIRDEATNEVKDYRKYEGLISQGIETPKDVPEWTNDRSELWNRVEAVEKRKDAQLAKQFIIALPYELNEDENKELTKEIVKEFVKEGMIVDWALHRPDDEGNEKNIHAHLLTTMRDITPEGFGKKNRSWNDKAFYDKLKIQVAEVINVKLRERGIELIDGRRYEVQNDGIENIEDLKVTQEHKGYKKVNTERRLKRINRQLEKLEAMGYGNNAGIDGDTGTHRSGNNQEQGRTERNSRTLEKPNRGDEVGESRKRETEPDTNRETSRRGDENPASPVKPRRRNDDGYSR